MAIIDATGLTKTYGKLTAVDHITIKVDDGEIFGFLGPNGAGKTTTINMLTTLTKPTGGTAKVAGFDIVKQAAKVRSEIGLVPQDFTVDEDLTGIENLTLHAKLYHLPRDAAELRIREVLQLVKLESAARRRVETYSGGMRKRLELAQGLIHFPKVLFLDEPTLGLDVQTRTVMWDYIRQLRDDHDITVFLTTHYMDEADKLCDRIAIIDQGLIKAMDSPRNLKDKLVGDIIELTLEDGRMDMAKELLGLPVVLDVQESNDILRLKVARGEEALPVILERISTAKGKVTYVSLSKPTLDQVYLDYTGRSLREEESSSDEVWRMRRNIRRMRQ